MPSCDPAFLEMLTKSVTMRVTTATCDGCVQFGMGWVKQRP